MPATPAIRSRIRCGCRSNAGPHKCSRIEWFPLRQLPTNTVPYTEAGIELFGAANRSVCAGWPWQPELDVLTPDGSGSLTHRAMPLPDPSL